jgi:hypothetical protein
MPSAPAPARWGYRARFVGLSAPRRCRSSSVSRGPTRAAGCPSPRTPQRERTLPSNFVVVPRGPAGDGGVTTTSSSAEAAIFAADGDPEVLDRVGRDGSSGIVLRTARLRWGSAAVAAVADYGSFANVVIGSDLTCNGGSWAALAETVSAILEPGGIVIYLARSRDASFLRVPLPPRVAPSSPHSYRRSAVVLLPS